MRIRNLCCILSFLIIFACGELIEEVQSNSTDEKKDTLSDIDSETDSSKNVSNSLMIDDCDDGDAVNSLGGIWLTYSDSHDPGKGESQVWPVGWFQEGQFTMSEPGYGGKGYAAYFKGVAATKLGYDYFGMISALGPNSFCPNPQPSEADIKSYEGIKFYAKGKTSGGILYVKMLYSKEGEENNCKDNGLTGDTLTNWNDFAVDITDKISEDWSEISLNFRRDFFGPDGLDIETVLEHAKDIHFFFQSNQGGEAELWVDNLALFREDTVTDTDADTDDGIDRSGEPESFVDPNEDDAAELFDRKDVAKINIELPDDTWQSLIKNAVNEEYTSAKVTVNGTVLDEVGLRFKGAYGSLYGCFDSQQNLICDKLSMKLKFDKYLEEQRYLGLKRLNLHSIRYDNTKMRDCLAYDVFREMGIVTPRCSYAYVYVNNEELGLYGMVEQIDGRFTNSRFSKGDGNLYKEAWPVNVSKSYYDEHLKTNEDVADHSAFVAFAKQMILASDTTLPQTLKKWMDMDYLQKYLAVDFAIANWDGVTTFYCGANWPCVNHNFYLYQEEKRPFFWIIPWDLEATFNVGHWFGNNIEPWDNLNAVCEDIPFVPGEDHFIKPAGCDQTFRAIVQSDRKPYYNALKELLETSMSEKSMLDKINKLTELLEPYIEADPFIEPDEWLAEIEYQISELNRIRARISAEL